MKNNFDRLIKEGVVDNVVNWGKRKVLKKSVFNNVATRKDHLKALKDEKDDENDKAEIKKLKTEARITHKELQDLGMAGADVKDDGTNIHRYGKNYLIGYYKKKIEDAKRDGDKFALRLAKDSIKSIEAAEGRLGKGRITIINTPEGS